MNEILDYFINNRNEMYKLIEVRDGNYQEFGFESNLDSVRTTLIKRELDNILSKCSNKKVYILGHNNPDADSIISSYILCNILKSIGIDAHFCVLEKNYEYTFHDKKLLEDNFKYKPEVISDYNKSFILVDHNDLQDLKKENVIGAFDHHNIKNEIDNILEIEYSSTCLLIYDLFKDIYSFSEEEKYLICLTVLSDTDYLTSTRFTEYDRELFDELGLNIDVKELQKKYFITTDFSLGVDKNFEINKKEYNRNGRRITRVQITSYDDEMLNDYISKAKELDYLLIWLNYKKNTTTIYYNNEVYNLDYLLSSTYLVFNYIESKIEKNNSIKKIKNK